MVDSLCELADEQHDTCEWRRRYARAQREVRKLRDEISAEKSSNMKMKQILVREIGTIELVEEALTHNSPGWIGRAQEIEELRKRVKQQSSNPVPPVAIVLDKKKTHELETSLNTLRAELAETDNARRALKARNHSLETMLMTAKCDIQQLLEKDQVNSDLVKELTKRLNLA